MKKRQNCRINSTEIPFSKPSRAKQLLRSLCAAGLLGLHAASYGFTGFGIDQLRASPSSGAPTSFKACPQHFAGGQPPITPAAPKLRELCFNDFAVLHSGNTKTPVYVAQRLNRKMLQDGQGIKRTDRFYSEARLPAAERAELEDYKGSGWSRGHMAPAGDMATEEGKAQSFSLANMVPQDPKQNGGPWSRVEEDTRKYVMRARGDVYVITGPVFQPGAETIGSGRVAVPSHVFKLVHDPNTGKSWAHWQENSPNAQVGRPISYQELASRTKMELLPSVAN
ncbi:MAG: DNA/RNA non-specific endonuclease [Acidovorax sp.]|uniref:DNA/RNA non-specific endonuclease n=1 Tax=Acidovorax sp. TaxID=1872122 RepID=UPI0026318438|nr:DNA/RNA non-specific endonuclease [Acidovorax sp.]MDH4417688.1 DNA/RNA non-specific endonuclease [Acidovorax sp.]